MKIKLIVALFGTLFGCNFETFCGGELPLLSRIIASPQTHLVCLFMSCMKIDEQPGDQEVDVLGTNIWGAQSEMAKAVSGNTKLKKKNQQVVSKIIPNSKPILFLVEGFAIGVGAPLVIGLGAYGLVELSSDIFSMFNRLGR